MVCYAMAKTSFSGKTMRNYHKAILTIPGDELKELVLKCGMSTGKKTDKVKEFNVEMESVEDSEQSLSDQYRWNEKVNSVH